jgi:hypothetical protein
MIGMNIPKDLTDLATRAVEALEGIAASLEAIDRGQTMERLGKVSRERQARDGMTVAEFLAPPADCSLGSDCSVPTDEALAATMATKDTEWPGFGTPCDRPLGVRGNCAKSLGHSGRCKP